VRLKLLASLCAALGLAVVPAVAPAAAATAKWAVVYYVPPQRTGEIIDGIAATGTGSAWAIAQFEAVPTSKDYSSLYRWNGKAWTAVATSGALHSYGFSLISASSPSNVVAVGDRLVGCCRTRSTVVRWNGTKWTSLPPVPATATESLLTFGAADTWVAALPAMYLWNGHSWKSYKAPGAVLAISGSAPAQIWGAGTSTSGTQPEIFRWNGTSWTVADRLPATPENVALGQISVTADSAKDAWVTGFTQNMRTSAVTPFLLHWNGNAWQRVKIPSSVHGVLSYIETDGSGGFWAASFVPQLSGFGTGQKMVHYSAGKWTALPVPAIRGGRDYAGDMMPTPRYLTNIPGTTAMWAPVLYVVNSLGAPDSVIMRYLP
jgi:hypothetical protein